MSKKEKDIESRIEGKPNLKGSPDEVCKIWSKLSLGDRIRIAFANAFVCFAVTKVGLGIKDDPNKEDDGKEDNDNARQ